MAAKRRLFAHGRSHISRTVPGFAVMDWYRLGGPALRLVDPETAHRLTVWALERGLAPRPAAFDEPAVRIRLWGIDFANPIGLAAGFDKDGRVPDAMLAQGFGFVEVGGVTPRPQTGNPRPRVFRLPGDGAVINRLGLNSEGMEAMAVRLRRRRSGPVGVNLGINADSEDAVTDYVQGARRLAALADYLVVNVSSPNTPGLRVLQGRDHLEGLLAAVQDALADLPERPPVLLKIAPDLTPEDKADIAEVALAARIDGLIATNTTTARPAVLVDRHRTEAGGLSGRPLFGPSTAVLGEMYRLTAGRIPLIGVGGVASGRDAYAKIRAGASLVQLYTALIYDGPGLVDRIKRELWDLLRRDGFATVDGAVGADHRDGRPEHPPTGGSCGRGKGARKTETRLRDR